LSMSAGAVSMTINELAKWGVVKKPWVPGERKDYYEPETSIWKMVSRVFRERELAQIRNAIEIFEEDLRELAQPAKKGDKKGAKFVTDRLETILQLARIGESLLVAILEGRKVEVNPIRAFSGP